MLTCAARAAWGGRGLLVRVERKVTGHTQVTGILPPPDSTVPNPPTS